MIKLSCFASFGEFDATSSLGDDTRVSSFGVLGNGLVVGSKSFAVILKNSGHASCEMDTESERCDRGRLRLASLARQPRKSIR